MIGKVSLPTQMFLLILLIHGNALAQFSFPVVITDQSGQSIHGLQKMNFDVRCGKPAAFESVEEVPPLKFNGFAEPVPIFILFDELTILRKRQTDVSRLLLQYLRKAADEHLAVTVLANTPEGIRVIHDMSTDPAVFTAAIDRVLPRAAGSTGQATATVGDASAKPVEEEVEHLKQLLEPVREVNFSIEDRYAHQLASLRAVGKMLQRSRKRKALVWISSLFRASLGDGGIATSYQAAVDALNDARMSVYPIGITADEIATQRECMAAVKPGDQCEDLRSTAAHQNERMIEALDEFATNTGGSRLTMDGAIYNDAVEVALQDFISKMSDLRRHFDSYYVLSFSVQPGRKRTWIDTSVKINKPEAKISASNGFFSSHE